LLGRMSFNGDFYPCKNLNKIELGNAHETVFG